MGLVWVGYGNLTSKMEESFEKNKAAKRELHASVIYDSLETSVQEDLASAGLAINTLTMPQAICLASSQLASGSPGYF